MPMTNKLSWNRVPRGRATKALQRRALFGLAALIFGCVPLLGAHNQAPDWMHALVNTPLPEHDEKANAALLYREENLTVLSADKFRSTVRAVYKILRPEGRKYGLLRVPFNSLNEKVVSVHAWCIPANGKDFAVTAQEAVEVAPLAGMELVTDAREKRLQIPAPDPGNIIGYEYVTESRPLVLQDYWEFQHTIPVKASHYSLTLPAGWEFKAAWANYPEVKPKDAGGGVWQWAVEDVKEIRTEEDMPPWQGLAGRMVVTVFPPGGAAANSLPTWREVGIWENGLVNGRLEASPEIKQQVSALTASAPTPLAKMRALAEFMQKNIRYVAIELGIGGLQPHPAPQIFAHRYGDCKDKATLLRTMLREIGIESYFVDINIERGAVTPETPPSESFNHVIVAIKLPDGVADPSLIATMKHPALGTLLIFDPTSEKTPFGQIGGYLQANYGLLVTPSGGELVQLPQEPASMNGIQRSAKLTLSDDGTLLGSVEENYVGDFARSERARFTEASDSSDHIKPLETKLADSLANFHIGNATISNATQIEFPFGWNYSFSAEKYAKFAGNLLLVRPRVLGRKALPVMETPEPRRYPIEFYGPERDTDDFQITLPHGYVVDDLPPATDADFPFASYHSKTEVAGNVLHYHRTYEVKQLSVPVSQAEQLKKFYRIIAGDERNTAVLKLP